MLKILIEKWDRNKDKLKEELKHRKMDYEYKDLVNLTFSIIYNSDNDDGRYKLDINNITEIDNGEYQGTLLYIIPFDTYQPNESEYLMTYVGYGSCSVCDTLLYITDYNYEEIPNEEQLNGLMQLCKDLITNTIKPYNNGWRKDEDFVNIEFKKEKDNDNT